MTQNKETTLLDSIQSEVANEASPMLDFLLKHASKIFFALVAFIVVVVAFGIWNYADGNNYKEAGEALGKILIMPEDANKIAALEEFSASAEKPLRQAALMALAQSASLQKQYDKAAAAWTEAAPLLDAGNRLVANISLANIMALGGRHSEALASLEALVKTAPEEMRVTINAQIVGLAEVLGEWDKAIAACEAIIPAVKNPVDQGLWQQRLAYFTAKK